MQCEVLVSYSDLDCHGFTYYDNAEPWTYNPFNFPVRPLCITWWSPVQELTWLSDRIGFKIQVLSNFESMTHNFQKRESEWPSTYRVSKSNIDSPWDLELHIFAHHVLFHFQTLFNWFKDLLFELTNSAFMSQCHSNHRGSLQEVETGNILNCFTAFS